MTTPPRLVSRNIAVQGAPLRLESSADEKRVPAQFDSPDAAILRAGGDFQGAFLEHVLESGVQAEAAMIGFIMRRAVDGRKFAAPGGDDGLRFLDQRATHPVDQGQRSSRLQFLMVCGGEAADIAREFQQRVLKSSASSEKRNQTCPRIMNGPERARRVLVGAGGNAPHTVKRAERRFIAGHNCVRAQPGGLNGLAEGGVIKRDGLIDGPVRQNTGVEITDERDARGLHGVGGLHDSRRSMMSAAIKSAAVGRARRHDRRDSRRCRNRDFHDARYRGEVAARHGDDGASEKRYRRNRNGRDANDQCVDAGDAKASEVAHRFLDLTVRQGPRHPRSEEKGRRYSVHPVGKSGWCAAQFQ